MVFREQTILQVRDMVDKLEHQPRRNSTAEVEIRRSSSVQEAPTQPKLPTSRHAKSCLASGLFHSVYKGRLKKVKFLLDNGLNVNARNDYGYSVLVAALHIDTDDKRRRMFKFLLENGADPYLKDPRYLRNALAWAAVLGRNEQVRLLLEIHTGEFDMHEKDRDGMTALHLATQSGYTDVVKSLVREIRRFGNSVDVPDSMGLTPFLHAKRLGYGLIADILRDEGGASEGQGDLFSFKKADEWRDIGIKERNQEVKRVRESKYEKAAIAGSARMLMEFEGPGYEIISIPTPKTTRKPWNTSRASSSDIDDDVTSSVSKTVRIRSPRSQISLPAGIELRPARSRKPSLSESPSGQRLDAMSLIQMREPKKGTAPKQFHSSELDTSKVKEYGNFLGNLTTMMEFLEMQHTKSFRRSVPPLRLPRDESVHGPKRSTMAIIFGKGKKGRKSPNKAPGSGGKGKDKSGKAKRQSTHKVH